MDYCKAMNQSTHIHDIRIKPQNVIDKISCIARRQLLEPTWTLDRRFSVFVPISSVSQELDVAVLCLRLKFDTYYASWKNEEGR